MHPLGYSAFPGTCLPGRALGCSPHCSCVQQWADNAYRTPHTVTAIYQLHYASLMLDRRNALPSSTALINVLYRT